MKQLLATIFLLHIFASLSVAQNDEFKFSLLKGPNGKPLGKIRNLCQDQYGYIWMAGESEKCIYRYDGNRFTIFRHDEADPNSLGGTDINSVYADHSGIIWVGSSQGLDRFDPSTGVFRHYRHSEKDSTSLGGTPTPIIEDHKGRIWVGTDNGLDRLDEHTGKFNHYRNEMQDPKSLSSNFVWTIYEDHQGEIWIGTGYPWLNEKPENGGLNKLNDDGTFTRYLNNPKDSSSLINNKVAAIFEDSRGVFWVGTSGDGLHTMDRKTGKFQRHRYDFKAPDHLSRPPLRKGEVNDKITFINEDSTGAIWIGTMYSGINRYDAGTNKVTYFDHVNDFADSTSWNAFTSRDGTWWVSTQNNNLFRVDPFRQSIQFISTVEIGVSFLEDHQGNLWVGTHGNGLMEYNHRHHLIHQFKGYPSDSLNLVKSHVMGLFQNNQDTLWIGTGQGLRKLCMNNKQFSKFEDERIIKDSVEAGVANIFVDSKGQFWFCRWGQGLIQYNPADHRFKKYLSDGNDSNSISSNQVNRIIEDKNGVIWTSGSLGINRLDQQTGHFKHYFPRTWINALILDSLGNFWAGTTDGLFRYDTKADKFLSFFDPQQEINATLIGGIQVDKSKNLWLSSPLGIIKLDPVTKETFIYGSRYGIDPTSLIFWASSYTDREGRLYFSHERGFYSFSPEELAPKKKFNIILTEFLVNSFPILPGKKSPIQKPIELVSNLDLAYNENNIAFNFAAIDYREPEAIRYFTMLEGYDDVWRPVTSNKTSNYFSIPAGDYVYRIKAFNGDGTRAEKAIPIHIRPPWWKTWVAYLLYGLISLAAIFFIFRLQKQRIIRIERHNAQLIELAQAKEIEKAYGELKATQAQLIQSEKMASLGELTAGIAHEIQNPLNFVNNFSEVNVELMEELKIEQSKQERNEQLESELLRGIMENEKKINQHGKRADAIVKGMLQHSRSSTGQNEPTDINAMADEYLRLSYHGLRTKDNSFKAEIKTDFDHQIGLINIIPQDIGRVLLNLFNNAFYAVDEKSKGSPHGYVPKVLVISRKLTNKMEISVIDNGNGIPKNVLDKVFQPFFTTKPPGQGTGLGLSISYDIIKAHQGEIKVETKEGQGTTFTVQLRLDKV